MNIIINIHMNKYGDKANVRRVQRTPKGQWTITIPSQIADALDFKVGEKIEWKLEKGELVLKRMI